MALQIGFSTKYYTLWDVSSSTEYTKWGQSYEKVYFAYLRNLSMDEEKAKQKAQELGCEDLEVNEDLFGRNRSFYSEKLPEIPATLFDYGRHCYKEIATFTEVKYLVWFHNDSSHHERKDNIVKRVLELSDVYVLYNDELITYEEKAEREARQTMFKKLKTAAINQDWIEVTFNRNLTEGYADDVKTEFGLANFEHNLLLKDNYYNGITYYLPIIGGKAKRIKKKTAYIKIKETSDCYFHITHLSLAKTKEEADKVYQKQLKAHYKDSFERAARRYNVDLKQTNDYKGAMEKAIAESWGDIAVSAWVYSEKDPYPTTQKEVVDFLTKTIVESKRVAEFMAFSTLFDECVLAMKLKTPYTKIKETIFAFTVSSEKYPWYQKAGELICNYLDRNEIELKENDEIDMDTFIKRNELTKDNEEAFLEALKAKLKELNY